MKTELQISITKFVVEVVLLLFVGILEITGNITSIYKNTETVEVSWFNDNFLAIYYTFYRCP